jgi:hypothetical protein
MPKTDYIVIELGIDLDLRGINIPELYYDIDLFDDGIIDYKIIFNGHFSDPLSDQRFFDKIISYYGNSVGFNSIDSSFCQDTVFWETYYTAINLLPGDTISDEIIFDTIPLSAFEFEYVETFFNGQWCYVTYQYAPSYELITPLKLSSGEKGYLETKVIYYDGYIILERIVLGTDVVLSAIPENLYPDYLKIYPNPSTGIVHFKYDIPFNEIQLMTVTDITGKQLKQYQNLKSFPDIEFVKSGYYFIKIQLDNCIIIKKIIVI